MEEHRTPVGRSDFKSGERRQTSLVGSTPTLFRQQDAIVKPARHAIYDLSPRSRRLVARQRRIHHALGIGVKAIDQLLDSGVDIRWHVHVIHLSPHADVKDASVQAPDQLRFRLGYFNSRD